MKAPYELLKSFLVPVHMPGMIEVQLTRMERLRTYLPWSWRSNHATKWIHDPNTPDTLRMRRMLTPETFPDYSELAKFCGDKGER